MATRSVGPGSRERWATGWGWRRPPTCASQLPPGAPLPRTLQTLAFWRDPHAYLAWCRKRYGHTFAIAPLRLPPLVFFSRPEDIREIVRSPADVLHPGAGAAVISPLVGEGSFMLAEEEDHLRGRRAVLPGLRWHVQQDSAAITARVEREIAAWPVEVPVALHPYLRALVLRLIVTTVFGEDATAQGELYEHLLAMTTVSGSLVLQEPQLRPFPPWRGMWNRFLDSRATVDELLRGLIERRASAASPAPGVLSALIEAASENGDLNVRQVRDDVMSILVAGHETTASELAWAVQFLAHHPDISARFVAAVGEDDERYISATIHEVLRHRPVFLFAIPRVVVSPVEIGGRRYNPPVHLVGCVHLMHHDPTLFREPDQFDPARFLAAEPPPQLWMPWGGGRKRCPGHHLALLDMAAVLKATLFQFRILPLGRKVETARWRSVVVAPGNGCRVVLHRRTSAGREAA